MSVSSDELFQRAVSAWQAEAYEADAVDALLVSIVDFGRAAALDLARSRLTARDADIRGVACQLLAVTAQRGDAQIRASVADLAMTAYRDELDPQVLLGIVRALGSAQQHRGLPVLTSLVTHPDSGVRFQVAAELPMVVGDPPDPAGIAALITLSADADADIRDWATFGLGSQTDADSQDIRDALWARVDDPDVDTRHEAVVALARRKDVRVLPVVAELLAQPSAGTLVFVAAAHLADPSLLPALRLFDEADGDVRAALQACNTG